MNTRLTAVDNRTDLGATQRMALTIVAVVEQFFDEAGCPLTDEQATALHGARSAVELMTPYEVTA